MYIILIILFINIAFAIMLLRVAKWYKFRNEDYWFYMLVLNLVALLMFLNEYFDVAADYPFSVKLTVAFISVFLVMEINKKPLVNGVKLIMNKLKSSKKDSAVDANNNGRV